ncbi:MAG: PaaI family thioesterase [Acidimicrobiia bacterium]
MALGDDRDDELQLPDFSRHVLGQLGLSFPDGRSSVSLPDADVLRDPDGHLNFGVLGVLLDMASSGAFADDVWVPWVHADITAHRLAPPQGGVTASARLLRRGKRTAVVDLDVRDDAGALVGASTQQITFLGPPPDPAPDRDRRQQAWQAMFDGTCRLARSLPEHLGIRTGGAGTWEMDHGPDRTNGLSGLHGGVTTTFVDVAAAGTVAERRGAPARTVSAAVRYLKPALHGPFTITPEVLGDDGRVAVVRTPVLDVEGTLVITADVHVG